ncbi:IgGFc-binding protein-like, partial [Saccostrea cucullata]|uniref:IgGFc-binding protein-like n=1 Tax=Saccostrea cuccullata TaxID=36930 RepID=UPI002ED1DD48
MTHPNNQQPKSLDKDEFLSNPCRHRDQKPNSSEKKNKELGSRGHSFLVSFIQSHNKGNETNRTIVVTSETDFNLTVSLPESQTSSLISVYSHRNGNITMKKLDVHYSLVPFYFTPEYKAIIIHTSVPTSVLSYHDYISSSGSTTVFPIDKLSTSYIISTATPAHYTLDSGSHFTVASIKDNSLVTIKFTTDHDINILLQGRNYGRGDTFHIILNKYQTFQIGIKADMSGTTITSSNPIAVFAGNRCTDVGYHGACSMLMEMVPPADKLDTIFIVPPNIHRYQSR